MNNPVQDLRTVSYPHPTLSHPTPYCGLGRASRDGSHSHVFLPEARVGGHGYSSRLVGLFVCDT